MPYHRGWKGHRSRLGALIAKLIAGKRGAAELADSEYIPDSAGAITLDAGTREEVLAMVREDPAVKSHAVEFEVPGD